MKRTLTHLLAVMLIVCLCATFMTACELMEERYSVTYVSGGGMGDEPKAEKYGEGDTFTVKGGDVFTRDGFTFVGWNDGEKTVQPDSEYTMPAKDVVFTAQWQQVQNKTLDGKWSGAQLDGKDIVDTDVMFDVEATIKRDGENGIYVVLSLSAEANDKNVGGSDSESGSQSGENDRNDDNPEDNLNPDNEGNPEDNMNPEVDAGENGNNNAQNGETSGNGGNGETSGNMGSGNGESQRMTMCAALYMSKDENGSFSSEGFSLKFADEKLTLTVNLGSSDAQKIEFEEWSALGTAPSVDGTYSAEDENGNVYTITFGEDPSLSITEPSSQAPDMGNSGDGNGEDSGVGQGGDDSGAGQGGMGQGSDDSGMGQGGDMGSEDRDEEGSMDIRRYDDMRSRDNAFEKNYDNEIMPIDGDDMTDGNGEDSGIGQGSDDSGAGQGGIGQGGDDSGAGQGSESDGNIDIEIESVGEYLVVFVSETNESNETELYSLLVLYEENGELVGNTGEGERLVFTETQAE